MSGLKVKDIFIDPNDFKPRDLAVPFSFPRDQERWMVRFTPEDFKTFWFQEQTAIQFVPCSEQGPNRNIRNQSGDTLLPFYITVPGNKGRPKTYDWSFRFQCRRHGSPRTLAINRPSIGTGCPVEIRLKKPVGMDAVLVDYRWQHNHDLSAKTLSNMPMGANERNWIKLKVAEGNDWKGIRALLRMDDDSMTEIEEKKHGGTVPPAFSMSYEDVRQTVYRQRTKHSRKSANPTLSVHTWIETIKQKGGKGIFIDGIAGEEDLYMFGWSTKFQLKVMGNNNKIVCMDSTHKTVKSLKPDPKNEKAFASAYLFTLLVKDIHTQIGVPIGFMVCNSESTSVLRTWLTWVKEECGLCPSKFMVDCSVVETEALKQVFGLLEIFYCKFHVGQAWERKMRDLHSVSESNVMRGPLSKVLNASSAEDQRLSWEAFEKTFSLSARNFIIYLKKWMVPERLVRWGLYFRSDYQHNDTNNLVESWHKKLKSQYLGSERNLRPDDLLYLLQGVVNIDFRTLYHKRLNNMIAHQLSSYDAKEKAKADSVDFITAQSMVAPNTDKKKFKVQSFAVTTGIKATYDVRTDEGFTIVVACRCSYYVRHQTPCRHMYVTARVYKGMDISYHGEPYELNRLQEQAKQNDVNFSSDSTMPPSLEQTLPQSILLLLQRQRADKAEQIRIAREKEKEQEIQDLEADLKGMVSEIVKAASPAKRKCTIEYFQTTVAGVRKVLHEIKGLNTIQAGHRCQ